MPTNPKRGEIWADDEGLEALVISSDSWNRRNLDQVTVLGVQDDRSDEAFTLVVNVEGADKTVLIDLYPVNKQDLTRHVATLDSQAQRYVESALRRALTPTPGEVRPGARRPAGAPLAGHVRFADLYIEGQGAKPVVVVSAEVYARSRTTPSSSCAARRALR